MLSVIHRISCGMQQEPRKTQDIVIITYLSKDITV